MSFKYPYPFNQEIKLPNPKELTPEQMVEIRNRWLSYPELYIRTFNKTDDKQQPSITD